MDNVPEGLNIVVHRGKHYKIERKHGEIVKNAKIQKSRMPFSQNSLQVTSKSELNSNNFSPTLHPYSLSNVVYLIIKSH